MAVRNLAVNIRIGLQQVQQAIGGLSGRFNLLKSSLRAVFRTAVVAGFFGALRVGFQVLQGLQNSVSQLTGEFATLNLAAIKTAAIISEGGSGFQKAFDEATNAARNMSTQVGYSALQIQEGLYTAAQAGLNLGDSMKVTGAAMKLATLESVDFQETLNSLIGITRAFGVEMSEIPKFADVLTTAMVKSKATLNDLFAGLSDVSSIASTAFGESTETFIDSAAALMVLNDAGVEGSKAGTRLRATMQKLMGGTNQTTTAFAKYGVNLFKADGASQKYLGTLIKGQKAFAGYSDRLNELKNAQFALVSSGKMFTSTYQQVDKQYRDAIARGGEYVRNNLAQVQSLKEKRDAMLSSGSAYEVGSQGSFQTLQEDIDTTSGSLNQLQSGLDDVYDNFTNAGGKLKSFATILNEIRAAAPTEVIGKAFGIRGGEGVMRLLNNLDKFNKYKATLEEYATASEKGKSITEDIFNKFLDSVLIKWQRMKNSVMGIFSVIADAIFEAMGPVLDPIQEALSNLFQDIQNNKDSFRKIFKGMADLIKPISVEFGKQLKKVGATLTDVFTEGRSVTLPIFTAQEGKLTSEDTVFKGTTAEKFRGLMQSIGSLFVEGLRAGLQLLMPQFIEFSKIMADAFGTYAKANAALWESIGVLVGGAMVKGFLDAFIAELPRIKSSFNTIMEGLGVPKKIRIGGPIVGMDVPTRLPSAGENNEPGGLSGLIGKIAPLWMGLGTASKMTDYTSQEKRGASGMTATDWMGIAGGTMMPDLTALREGGKGLGESFDDMEKTAKTFGVSIIEANKKAKKSLGLGGQIARQVFQGNSKVKR